LNEIIEASETFRVFALIDVNEGAYFGCCEGDVMIPYENFEFLPANPVGLWPAGVILLHYLAIFNNALQFVQDQAAYKSLLPDHRIVLVIGVIGISKFAVRLKFKLEEFMAKFPLVPDIVTEIKLIVLL